MVKDISGNRYGRLTVIKRAGSRNGRATWLCNCDCGGAKIVGSHELQNGKTKSCGCLDRENRKHPNRITHNETHTRLHDEWRAMKWRCSPKYHLHHRYYDRGIKVCEEWEKSFEKFRDWAIDNGYNHLLTLDRRNNDKGYSPDNCRWVTVKEQQNNTSNNIVIPYMGKRQTLKQWSEELNLNYGMLKMRYKRGWGIDRLFSPPTR